MNRSKLVLFSLLLFLFCAGSKNDKTTPQVPDWVLKTPVKSGALYSVGFVGRTFFPEDGIRNASDAARKELAKSLGGKVQSVLLYVNSVDETNAEEAYIVEATSWASDIVISGSTIVSTWIDKDGIVPNSVQGATYALCTISQDNILSGINDYLLATLSEEKKKLAMDKLKETIKH